MIGISLKGDNMMTDQQKNPTKQTRHIVGDIQYIDTRYNPADGFLAKTLGRILNSEHVYRAMGLYGSPHKFGSYKNSHEKHNRE